MWRARGAGATSRWQHVTPLAALYPLTCHHLVTGPAAATATTAAPCSSSPLGSVDWCRTELYRWQTATGAAATRTDNAATTLPPGATPSLLITGHVGQCRVWDASLPWALHLLHTLPLPKPDVRVSALRVAGVVEPFGQPAGVGHVDPVDSVAGSGTPPTVCLAVGCDSGDAYVFRFQRRPAAADGGDGDGPRGSDQHDGGPDQHGGADAVGFDPLDEDTTAFARRWAAATARYPT